MRDLYISRSQMRELAPLAFEKAGVPIETASLDVSDNRYPWAIAASADGLLDLDARSPSDDHVPAVGKFHRGDGPGYYYWRGLVRADQGVFTVTHDPLRTACPDKYRLAVKATTSPQGYNEVQRALGRKPGVDSFELVRLAVAAPGHFTAGKYTATFANRQVPCADLTIDTQIMAEHDVDPQDHAASWLCSPPAFCNDVANRAEEIIRIYGDRMHDEQDPPDEVVLFALGIDELSGAANGLLELVSGLVQPAPAELEDGARHSSMPGLAALGPALEPQPASIFDPEFVPDMHCLLKRLGLITPDMTETEAQRLSIATVASRMGYISSMLLRLEDVVPLNGDTAAARNQRVDVLNTAQKAMAEQARQLTA